MNERKLNALVIIAVPTITERGSLVSRVSTDWAASWANIQTPLGCTFAKQFVKNKIIDEARNEIVRFALHHNSDWVFFVGDDVHVPHDALLRMLKRDKKIVTGVYFTKDPQPHPYIWRGNYLKGPFVDWKFGEFFEIDYAGCDCLLVHTDVFKSYGPPWFSRKWVWRREETGFAGKPETLSTEDYYFYAMAKKMGFEAWCDAAVLCKHEDRHTGDMYGLMTDMKQWVDRETVIGRGEDLIAILGAGRGQQRYYGEGKIIRFDINETTNPDVRCDIIAIPEPPQKYDKVVASHVLEHIRPTEAPTAVEEWIRILKVGGELIIDVPDLEWACQKMVEGKAGTYEWAMLYGQDDPYENHLNGFTKAVLENLLKSISGIDILGVQNINNLEIRAVIKKIDANDPLVLGEIFDETEIAQKLRNRVAKRNAKKLKKKKVKKVLNVGCGAKTTTPICGRWSDYKEIRFDVDPDCKPDIIGDARDLKAVKTNSMDAIFTSHFLEHLYLHEIIPTLKNFKRVLKSGGEVQIHVPDIQYIAAKLTTGRLEDVVYQSKLGPITAMDMIYGLSDVVKSKDFYAHKCGFTKKVLKDKLMEAGFNKVKVIATKEAELCGTGFK